MPHEKDKVYVIDKPWLGAKQSKLWWLWDGIDRKILLGQHSELSVLFKMIERLEGENA